MVEWPRHLSYGYASWTKRYLVPYRIVSWNASSLYGSAPKIVSRDVFFEVCDPPEAKQDTEHQGCFQGRLFSRFLTRRRPSGTPNTKLVYILKRTVFFRKKSPPQGQDSGLAPSLGSIRPQFAIVRYHFRPISYVFEISTDFMFFDNFWKSLLRIFYVGRFVS